MFFGRLPAWIAELSVNYDNKFTNFTGGVDLGNFIWYKIIRYS